MTCTFFGHRFVPQKIEPTLRSTLIDLIENHCVELFYVGNHGDFDAMVRRALRELSAEYPIKYHVVLAYMRRNVMNSIRQTIPIPFSRRVSRPSSSASPSTTGTNG